MAKYLVLRKRPAGDADLFLERASAAPQDDFIPPFEARTEELLDREAADLRRDPAIDDLIPSIPFTLINPVEDDPASVRTAEDLVWGLDAVRATASPQTGAGVTVAVLDTGIDREHPAFSGIGFDEANLRDFTVRDEGVPGAALDVNGHGTHVAGTIFGRMVNGERIGVAPGVTRVLIGKVLGPQGGSTEALYNAIMWALQQRADIISMSLGMDFPGLVQRSIAKGLPADIAASRALAEYRSNVRLFDGLARTVQAAMVRGRGALLVAASGNESRREVDRRFTVAVAPPAAADGFIPVGAVSATGAPSAPFAVAPFSNTGCLLSAPGVRIRSAKRGGGLTSLNGTSMATPHVAGVMALWIQKLFPAGNRPGDWARDVQRTVESHAIAAPGQSRDDVGLGVVQAPLG